MYIYIIMLNKIVKTFGIIKIESSIFIVYYITIMLNVFLKTLGIIETNLVNI